MNKEILNQIKEYFKNKVLQTVVRMNIRLAEAQAHRKSIFEYDKNSNGARDYMMLAEEVIRLTRPSLRGAEGGPRESGEAISTQGLLRPFGARNDEMVG